MAYVVPTLDEMHSFLVALFKTLLPTRSVSRWSFNWKLLRAYAGGITDNHAHIHAVQAGLLPDTAEGEDLERWGNVLGVTKKAATAARKANALRVVGVAGSAIPLGQELTHESGLRFQINEAAIVPAEGRVDVDVVAIDKGSATRLGAGEVLTFIAPPAGLEESAELVLALDEDGEDNESDGAYRLRILSRLASPPLGGSAEDYAQWALELEGVASAYVYPNRQGVGTVDVAALHAGRGTARILNAGEVAEVLTHLDEERPVSVASLRVLDVFAEPVFVDVAVLPTGDSQYEFDWVDSTPLVVNTWTPGTRTLQFTTPRPGTMKAGDRLTIAPTSGAGDGAQLVIESLSSTNAVVLETVPAVAPVASDIVYAGGPLVDPVRNAILAHIDSLGTANPDGHRYGAWEGNLRPAALIRIASLVPGVLDVESVLPVATIEAADSPYPDDTSIGLLVPGRVIVRRAW